MDRDLHVSVVFYLFFCVDIVCPCRKTEIRSMTSKAQTVVCRFVEVTTLLRRWRSFYWNKNWTVLRSSMKKMYQSSPFSEQQVCLCLLWNLEQEANREKTDFSLVQLVGYESPPSCISSRRTKTPHRPIKSRETLMSWFVAPSHCRTSRGWHTSANVCWNSNADFGI